MHYRYLRIIDSSSHKSGWSVLPRATKAWTMDISSFEVAESSMRETGVMILKEGLLLESGVALLLHRFRYPPQLDWTLFDN
jgi:hypothetical protein